MAETVTKITKSLDVREVEINLAHALSYVLHVHTKDGKLDGGSVKSTVDKATEAAQKLYEQERDDPDVTVEIQHGAQPEGDDPGVVSDA